MINKTPTLAPVTRQAKKAIENRPYIAIDAFPFRVGRESRLTCREGLNETLERRNSSVLPNNDLYLLTKTRSSVVSREHFLIQRTEDGKYELVDRGSTLGTTVAGHYIAGNGRGGRVEVQDGNRIAIGIPDSRYVFEFRLSTAPLRSQLRRGRVMRHFGHFFLFVIAPVVISLYTIASILSM